MPDVVAELDCSAIFMGVKTMIELYSTNVETTENMIVTWDKKSLQIGNTATLSADKQTINLNAPGVYRVHVNAYGSTDAAGTFGFQLQGNGVDIVRGASSQGTGTTVVDAAVAFETNVRVMNAPAYERATIALEYTGSVGNLKLIDIIVERVR